MIADRLKSIGDDLESEYGRTKLEDLATAISDMVLNSNLSWRRVAEIFKLLCKVMEARTRYDDQFSLFEKAWYCLIDSVVPWIQDRGGWVSPYTITKSLHAASKHSKVMSLNVPSYSLAARWYALINSSCFQSLPSFPVSRRSKVTASFCQGNLLKLGIMKLDGVQKQA